VSPSAPDPTRLRIPLSDEEIDELDQFLLSDAVSDDAMLLDMLDGYLTAIVIGPTTIPPSQWLPGVWGESEDDAPEFESAEQAQRILELMLRHTNDILWSMQDDPDAFEPFLSAMQYEQDSREYLDGEMWAHGFVAGVELCREDWQPLFDDPDGNAALRPLILLGADDLSEEEEKLTRSPARREELAGQIAASVAAIYRFWLPRRKEAHERLIAETVRRTEPKVGRNDPCPCGSGKKFKKCCGATKLH
jgi:uncharacterized protein